jgi:fructokinase
MFGGIEAGGTKFVCAVGTGPGDLAVARFPTRPPAETLPDVVQFFRDKAGKEGLQAIGIGSFGPVDLDRTSTTYGHITSTPKIGWSQYDLAGTISEALSVPVGFDTDTNASLLGEARWGSVRGLSSAVYLTIGTGIGGGALVDGHIVHGLIHPEVGHLRIPHDLVRDPFTGSCSYHGDCFEGLASGPALEARWGRPGSQLEPGHPGWLLEAQYIALGIVNVALVASPQRIVLGGGVMQNPHLFPLIRSNFCGLLNGYLRHQSILEKIDEFIVPPQLGPEAGVLGALVLAEQALAGEKA